MGKFRGLDDDLGAESREHAAIWRAIRELRAARSLQSSSIAKGGFSVREPADFTIVDSAGNVVWSAADGPIKTDNIRMDVDSTTLPLNTGWDVYPYGIQFQVPQGYTRAQMLVFATAGKTVSGTGAGNIGVQPFAGGGIMGPAVTNGINGGGPVSVGSYASGFIEGLADGATIYFGTSIQSSGDPTDVGSDNYHVSATAIFLR